GTAVFFSHFLPWAMYLGCAGLAGLAHRGLTKKSFAQRIGVWLVPAIAGALVMRGGSGHPLGRLGHGGGLPLGPAAGKFPRARRVGAGSFQGPRGRVDLRRAARAVDGAASRGSTEKAVAARSARRDLLPLLRADVPVRPALAVAPHLLVGHQRAL